MTYKVGQTVQYVDTQGHVKAAIILVTHDSVPANSFDDDGEVEDTQVIQPSEGFVHIAIFGLTDPFHTQPRPNVPTREMAESIPDYTIEGQLVGFVQAV